MESALATAGDDPMLFPQHLPVALRIHLARNGLSRKEERKETTLLPGTFKESRQSAVAAMEKRYLQDLMSFALWDINKACKLSCLSRPRLYGLLQKHGITRENIMR
jgi:two-component system NtrC family response regulator